MINFFPTIYEDELLYSAIARYHIMSGNISTTQTIDDLFSKKYTYLNKVLPVGITAFISNMHTHCKYTEDEIINNHTLYKFYTAFFSQELSEEIMNRMKCGGGGNICTLIGVHSVTNKHNHLKYCPICVKEDIEKYGEAYWKRVHQVPGILVCHIHKEILVDSNVSTYYENNDLNLLHGNSIISCTEKKYTEEILSKLYLIATDIDYIMKSNLEKRDIKWFKQNYLNYLKKMNLVTKDGRIKKRKLIESFKSYYGEEILDILDSNINYDDSYNWIIGLLGKREIHINTLRHILFIRFLGISVSEIFNKMYEYKPFGDGPWPCLNSVCSCYHKDTIDKVHITYNYKSNKHIGTFSCECGFTYTRQENSEFNDKYKYNTVKQFGHIWESRLIEIVNRKQFNLRQIAYQMNVDHKTIDKYAEKLNLETYWRKSDEERYSNNIEYKKEKFIDYRAEWLKILNDNKDKCRTEIIKTSKGLYLKLYKYDREWLFNNMPKSNRHTYKVRNTVDWDKRDYKILEEVKLIVNNILNSDGKPIRLTKSRIINMTNKRDILKRNIDKMPLTKKYINSIKEDIKSFRIRKIKWAIKELINNGRNLNLTNVKKLISLKNSNFKDLKTIIEYEIESAKKSMIEN